MKKVSLFFVIFVAAVLFAGCAPKTEVDVMEHPWSVGLVIQYKYTSNLIKESVDAFRSEFSDDEFVYVNFDNKTLQIDFYFEEYDDFVDYFELDAQPVDYLMKESLFFYERTLTFENPFKTVLVDPTSPAKARIEDVNNKVTIKFGVPTEGTDYYYLFETSFRRRIANTYHVVKSPYYYGYYFSVDKDNPHAIQQIEIFDRYSNSPIWYAIGVAATAIFMVIMYFIFAKSKKKSYTIAEVEPWQSQSSVTSTET